MKPLTRFMKKKCHEYRLISQNKFTSKGINEKCGRNNLRISLDTDSNPSLDLKIYVIVSTVSREHYEIIFKYCMLLFSLVSFMLLKAEVFCIIQDLESVYNCTKMETKCFKDHNGPQWKSRAHTLSYVTLNI